MKCFKFPYLHVCYIIYYQKYVIFKIFLKCKIMPFVIISYHCLQHQAHNNIEIQKYEISFIKPYCKLFSPDMSLTLDSHT